MRLSSTLAFSAAALLSACAPNSDLDVIWTIDGAAASEDTCGAAVEGVRVKAFSSPTRDGDKTETTASFDCSAGTGTLQTSSFAEILVELTRGEDVVGGAELFEVQRATGLLVDGDAVTVDTTVTVGLLSASLKVGSASCDDAGASSFDVRLTKVTNGVDFVEVDDASVSCDDGEAVYMFGGAQVGGIYALHATTTIGGVLWSTAGSGARVEMNRAAVGASVNLIRVDDE